MLYAGTTNTRTEADTQQASSVPLVCHIIILNLLLLFLFLLHNSQSNRSHGSSHHLLRHDISIDNGASLATLPPNEHFSPFPLLKPHMALWFNAPRIAPHPSLPGYLTGPVAFFPTLTPTPVFRLIQNHFFYH